MAGIIIIGEISMIAFLLTLWLIGTSSTEQGIINLIYGICMAYHSGFMLVLGYFFGSTKGSAEKTDLLYNSTPIQK
jgi:hypothetical protein